MYPNANVNVNLARMFWSQTSLSQTRNAASKVDIAFPTSQSLDIFTLPLVPGLGKEYVIEVSPDFDNTFEFGN